MSDGSADRARVEEEAFLEWLRKHGAMFHSVDWPSSETKSGIRGAIALRDIEAEDHMIQIPHTLMMSEVHAKADPDRGHVHRLNTSLLKGDNGLVIFIMQEILKKEASFYWPYLRVLPRPHNLRNWKGESLLQLQNPKLVRKAAARSRQLRSLYHETIEFLSHAYPELYTADRYTFDLFDFAWGTVQARAFGKRLKNSALVPFADCLNHGNVQTKYDFDVEGNGTFRLFPSGTNRYPRRSEVLNSYGRRGNDNLLLDYGFAMLDNEWDTAEVVCSFPPRHQESPADMRREAVLRASGQHTVRILRVRRDVWSAELLRFCRCVCLTTLELDKLESGLAGLEVAPATVKQQVETPTQASRADSLRPRDIGESVGAFVESAHPAAFSAAQGGACRCSERPLQEETRESQDMSHGCGGNDVNREQRGARGRCATALSLLSFSEEDRPDSESDGSSLQRDPPSKQGKSLTDRHGWRKEGGGGGGGGGGGDRETLVVDSRATCRFPCRVLSAQNEVAALTQAVDFLVQARDKFPTTLEQDENVYQEAREAKDAPSDLLNALVYRITIKRILSQQLEMAGAAITFIQQFMRERSAPELDDEGGGGGNGGSFVNTSRCLIASAHISSSRLDHPVLWPSRHNNTSVTTRGGCGGGGNQEHFSENCLCDGESGSPSFALYLSEVESTVLPLAQQEEQLQSRSPRSCCRQAAIDSNAATFERGG